MFFDMAVAARQQVRRSTSACAGMASFRMEQYERRDRRSQPGHRAQAATRPYYYWNLGLALWYLDRYPESAQAYSEYIRLKPDEPTGYNERADVYEAMGRNDLAAKDRATAKRLKSRRQVDATQPAEFVSIRCASNARRFLRNSGTRKAPSSAEISRSCVITASVEKEQAAEHKADADEPVGPNLARQQDVVHGQHVEATEAERGVVDVAWPTRAAACGFHSVSAVRPKTA